MLVQIGIEGIANALPVVFDHPPSTFQLTAPPFLVLGGTRCKSILDTLIRLESVSVDLEYLGSMFDIYLIKFGRSAKSHGEL